jgi:leader peptidase (prepilin peptidase)/N-methyltransferase
MISSILFSTAAGLMLGSFANVYFHRIPLGRSLIWPGSACPSCGAPVRWFDNIPVLSYLLLKGRCRSCSEGISPRYPFVEALCGLLFAAVALKFGREPLIVLTAFLAFAFLLFLIAGIDLVTFFQNDLQFGIIPDHLSILLAASGIAFCAFNPVFAHAWEGLAGAGGAAAFMLFVRWLGEKMFHKESLGLGDVKMMSAAGLWLGWTGFTWALILGAGVGSAVGITLLWTKKLDRQSPMPFGPFLSLGCLGALLFFV